MVANGRSKSKSKCVLRYEVEQMSMWVHVMREDSALDGGVVANGGC